MADRTQPAYRERNALKWIKLIAGLHYFGDAFNPEHMRTLANIAADALAGQRDLPDFEESQAEGKRRAREMADALGFDLVGDDELGDHGGHVVDSSDHDQRISADLAALDAAMAATDGMPGWDDPQERGLLIQAALEAARAVGWAHDPDVPPRRR